MEQSAEKARQTIKGFFNLQILHMFWLPRIEEGFDGLRGRPTPSEMKNMIDWYYSDLSTKDQKITFLRQILRGTATKESMFI